MCETRKLAAILVADVVGYSLARGSGRGSHPCAVAGTPQRFDPRQPHRSQRLRALRDVLRPSGANAKSSRTNKFRAAQLRESSEC